MDQLQQHQNDVGDIRDELNEWLKHHNPQDNNLGITLAQQKHVSNTVRENSYRSKGPSLGINKLNRVLKVDAENKIAVVEPRVSMEQLADATLPYGLVPAVLPEFKSITVGGAINGAAIESTSHKYGQFNDICRKYEVLLGDGTVVSITAENSPDLFYGISGSYGSLGVILSVEIELVEAPEWVLLNYHDFTTIEQAVQFMKDEHQSDSPPEYIEAIVYNKECTVVITGNSCEDGKLLANTSKVSFGKPWDKWYYQVVKERFGGAIRQEAVKIKDYLFRQDRAGFWMGGYALHPLVLFRYTMEYFGHVPRWLEGRDITQCYQVKMPSWWFRWLFGWTMNSEHLYNIMHKGTEQWFAKNFSIQDYYLPDDTTVKFTEHVINQYEILPIWLCPMKATKTQQIFSPHYSKSQTSSLMFDVGVYGMAKNSISGEAVVRDLDSLSVSMGGRKMLYSYSYYTSGEFWEIYSKQPYEELRGKYSANSVFLDITKKVLS
jgi:Delta24-sterol reductase